MRWGWKVIWLTVAGVVLVQLTLTFFPSLIERSKLTQPVAFNHKKHAGELAFPCAACHPFVETQPFAGLPQTETCMACHAAPLTKNPEEEKIRSYSSKGEKIPWRRIYQVPGDVFFSHRRHIVSAKIECSVCHGKMAEQTAPPPRPLVNQTMEWCIACHQVKRASVDCNACHR